MVIENQANNDFNLTTEDINAAFQAHPQAAQTAQINLLRRLINNKDEQIANLKTEMDNLLAKGISDK